MSLAGSADPLVGRTLDGRYHILAPLARGGMSRVYRAEQHPLGRTVALKVLAVGGDPSQEAEFRQRFQLEASVCARLTHPNTVRVFDHGRVGDELIYIAMELLEGRTLHQVIKAEAPLDAGRIIALARQICGSLREAHQLGLIHRDLKPANVILTRHGDEDDFVKVLDFGLVKQLRTNDELTGVDAVVGSPSYMSPEQIRADKLDVRSDIYSLGVILYSCVAGKAPFTADTSVGVLLAHLNQEPPPIPADNPALLESPLLGWVVRVCLAKNPDERFADVDELLRALKLCDAELRGQKRGAPALRGGRMVLDAPGASSLTAPRPPLPSAPEPSVSTVISAIHSRRLPLLAATGAAAGLLAVAAAAFLGAGIFWWWSARSAEPAAEAPPAVTPPTEPTTAAIGPVHFVSEPAGATLRHGDTVLGVAPLDVEVPLGQVWEVTASAPGHEDTRLRVPWDARRRVITLPKAAPAATRRSEPLPAPATTPRETTAPPPDTPEPSSPQPRKGGDLKDPWAP